MEHYSAVRWESIYFGKGQSRILQSRIINSRLWQLETVGINWNPLELSVGIRWGPWNPTSFKILFFKYPTKAAFDY